MERAEPHGERFVGIDIGGTKLAVGLALADGTILAEAFEPSHAGDGPDAMIGRVVEMARSTVADAGLRLADVAAVGIGCGGPLDAERGIVLNALNNPGWIGVPLVERVSAALGRPAFLENDANAAALAEHRFGAGRGVANLIYLTISTGIGGAVILDGRLRRGANGNAGELGHISVDHRGASCHCGGIGCLEAYASGTSLARRAGMADAAAVVEAVRAGDPGPTEVWDETMAILGAGIASMINAFNPQRVIIGGGIAGAGDLLFDPVRRIALGRAMPELAAVVEIVPAELGPRGGILGAVAVAADRSMERQPA
jgi:glucokinase